MSSTTTPQGRPPSSSKNAMPAARTTRLGKAQAGTAGTPRGRTRRTQAERREEAERRVLEAALGILANRGGFRMSLAEVGEKAGYSRGLPAIRFGDKTGLLRALIPYIGQRYFQKLAAISATVTGLAAIRSCISFYFSRKEKGWPATRSLLVLMTESLMEPCELREDVAQYNRTTVAWFEENIRIGMDRGEIRQIDSPGTAAQLILAAMRGAILQCLVDPKIDVQKVRAELLAMVDNYLTA